MYTPQACSSEYVNNAPDVERYCRHDDDVNNITNIALTILLVGAVVTVLSLIVHPVLLIPGCVIAVAGTGTLIFSFDAPRTFVSNFPTYFSSSSPGRYSYTPFYPASRPARAPYSGSSSAFVSTGGFGGVGVFNRR